MGKSYQKKKRLQLERAFNVIPSKTTLEEIDENQKNLIDSSWKTFWDKEAKCHYYWNKITNQSSYYPPSENSNTFTPSYNSYYNNFMGKEYDYDKVKFGDGLMVQYTEVKEGVCCKVDTVNPSYLDVGDRAARQCRAFFDYDNYVEQRGQEGRYRHWYGLDTKPKFTKKQINKLHKNKMEKKDQKKRKWLMDI